MEPHRVAIHDGAWIFAAARELDSLWVWHLINPFL
jgi:hypothetical protein